MHAPSRSPFREFVASLPEDALVSVWLGPVVGPPDHVHREHEPHYAASTMKLPVLLAAHRLAEAGRIDLDTPVRVHDDFGSALDGTVFTMQRDYDNDDLVWERLEEHVPLRWLLERMVVRSSNLATNLVLEQVGITAVQELLSDLALEETVVSRGIEDVSAREAGLDNRVSAADLARTLQAAFTSSAAMGTLERQELRDTIPAGLPEGVRVAHKSGWVEGIVHDAGIVLPADADPFILVVCTTSSLSEAEGRALIARAATAAWQERGAST